MSDSRLDSALRESFEVTIETMAFEQAFPLDETPDDWQNTNCIHTTIHIEEPLEGTLILIASKQCAEEIAMNIVGPPEDDSPIGDSMIADTLGEIMNTVAGRLMQKLLEGSSDFTLSLPESTFGDCPEIEKEFLVQYYQLADFAIKMVALGSGFETLE